MGKRVCVIRSNSVDPDSRVEKEVSTLRKLGYEVTILAWDRESDHKKRLEHIDVYDEKIEIVRFGIRASYGEGFKNIVPYLKFQLKQFCWLFANRREIDIIHACDFDTAFVSSMANRVLGKKYVFDIFDFLYGEPKNGFQKIIKRLQIGIINYADATIICTEDRKNQIQGARPKRLAVIHNTPKRNLCNAERPYVLHGDKIKVVYVGILQDYRLLLEIGEFFTKTPEIELHIGGFGKYESNFKELSVKSSNIFFYGKLTYDRTIALEREANIMLAIYDPAIENHRYAAPNKFYESLMLGKPLIMVRGTGMSEYITAYRIGELIDYSADSFAEGLDRLIRRKAEWKDIGEKMRELYRSEYSWEKMEKELKTLYIALSEERDCHL